MLVIIEQFSQVLHFSIFRHVMQSISITFIHHWISNSLLMGSRRYFYSTGEFNWLSLWCLVPWINHLPPVYQSTMSTDYQVKHMKISVIRNGYMCAFIVVTPAWLWREIKQEALRERKPPPRLVWGARKSLVKRETVWPITSCVHILTISWISILLETNTDTENKRNEPCIEGM